MGHVLCRQFGYDSLGICGIENSTFLYKEYASVCKGISFDHHTTL